MKDENSSLVLRFMEVLKITEPTAVALVEGGFTSLEEIAYAPRHELASELRLEGVDVDQVRDRAQELLIGKALFKRRPK